MKLHLPKNVSETSSTIYRKAFKKDLIRGRSIRRGVAAVIYMACRQCNIIRSIKEIECVSLISSKDIARTYRFLKNELKEDVPQSKPKKYVAKRVNQLKLPGYVENMSGKIIDNSAKLVILNGRSPARVASTTTYIACVLMNVKRTQGQISKSVNLTEVTLRNRYKEIVKNLDFMLLV